MQDVFITKVHINKVRHLENIDIELSDTERKHLIITGKNGSGKTSLLEAMQKNAKSWRVPQQLLPNQAKHSEEWEKTTRDDAGVTVSYMYEASGSGNFIFAYKSASRSKFIVPRSIEPVDAAATSIKMDDASIGFLKYMLSLDYRLYGAKTENNVELVDKLEKWFDDFTEALREIYSCRELELTRDTRNFVFRIKMPDREPFGLHEMADGYTAFLEIFMELLLRFASTDAEVDYKLPAIVMIDEIETHLHVELQKRVLPFLTRVFPNVQFIVSTHSPFVITSLENAIIYDLEKRERLDSPSFYSYETIVESFLDTDMYSNQLKDYFKRYEELCLRPRTPEENIEFIKAKTELELRSIPSTELYIAFQDLERKRKAMKNGSSD